MERRREVGDGKNIVGAIWRGVYVRIRVEGYTGGKKGGDGTEGRTKTHTLRILLRLTLFIHPYIQSQTHSAIRLIHQLTPSTHILVRILTSTVNASRATSTTNTARPPPLPPRCRPRRPTAEWRDSRERRQSRTRTRIVAGRSSVDIDDRRRTGRV